MPQKRLRLTKISQEKSEWCGLAAAEMVLRYLRTKLNKRRRGLGLRALSRDDIRQCMLANKLPNRSNCCDNPMPGNCNVGINAQDVGDLYIRNTVASTPVSQPIDFPTLTNEIEARRPVEVAYERNGGGHLVIVRGYRKDRNNREFVTVNDPWPFFQSGELTFDDFQADEDGRPWSKTWTGIRPQ